MMNIENADLKEMMLDNGVLHEVNRTFFHPLGLALALVYYESCERSYLILQQYNEKGGDVFEKLDKFKMEMFRNFANIRYMDREEEYGFIIQARDFEEVDRNYSKTIELKTARLNIVFKYLSNFIFEMQKKIIKHHETHDDDNQMYSHGVVFSQFNKALDDGDWESVANWAMVFKYYTVLYSEINSLEMKEATNEKSGSGEKNP